VSAVLLGGCAALLASGCGGGSHSGSAQTHAEGPHTYEIEVLNLTFKPAQRVGRPASMRIEVLNADTQTIPDIAVTLDSFYYTERYPELAANKRPIWVVERGPGARAKPPVQTQEVSQPGGAQTVYVNTWALGPLAHNGTRTFTWHVVPVKAGVWTVHYRLAAGLAGKARAQLPAGGPVQGQLTASVGGIPPSTHVDPTTGRVLPGTYPLLP
jgi:hypothetical protein